MKLFDFCFSSRIFFFCYLVISRKKMLCGYRGGCRKAARGVSCRGCGEIEYCGEDCKRQHWTCGHKEECTKLDELKRLHAMAVDVDDYEGRERMADACIKAIGKYLSKRLKSLEGKPVPFEKFFEHFTEITLKLTQCSRADEHNRIMSETLDEAEQLEIDRKLVSDVDSGLFYIQGAIKFLRAQLLSKRGELLANENIEASLAMFEQALSIAREIKDPALAHMSRFYIEKLRAKAYLSHGDYHEAVRCYEEAYVIAQEHVSPDDISVQTITNELVDVYRLVDDHEKADHCAEVLVENLENHYRGRSDATIGFALRSLAEGIFLRARDDKNENQQVALFNDYERHMWRALFHFKEVMHRGMYYDTMGILVRFLVLNDRFSSSDLLDLINQHSERCLELKGQIRSRRGIKADKALSESFDYLLAYCDYRERAGPPLTEDECKLVARWKTENQKNAGLSAEDFEVWCKQLAQRMEKIKKPQQDCGDDGEEGGRGWDDFNTRF